MSTVLRNGMIVDGTGGAPYRADLWIERDTIREIGQIPDIPGARTIDVQGLYVTPGLIDCHTHSELRLMVNRQHPGAVYSGVSTVVVGQCGLGFAPIRPEDFESAIQMNAGIFEDRRTQLPRWSSFGEYLRYLEGCAVNVASCVPHNAIRQWAMGFSDAPLRGDTLRVAEDALDTALTEGGVAFSIGLSYYPGTYADTDELIALCRVAARHDAVFCVHSRLNIVGPSFDPLAEIAKVVEQTGVRLHMLHYATLPGNTIGDPEAMTRPFEDIVRKGATVTYEFYPYLAGSGFALVFLPGWAQADGYDAIMERLTDPALRNRLLNDIEARYPLIARKDERSVLMSLRDPYDPNLNRAMEDIAAERGERIAETIVSLLVENRLCVGFHGSEPDDESIRKQLFDDRFTLFSHPQYTIGSDAIPAGEFCHPRAFGTYPRVLKLARERGMPVERAIRKLTALPAEIYRLDKRGILAPGYAADICLLDYERIADTATFEEPRRKPEGIDTLLVNGIAALRYGGITGLLSGRALKAAR